MEVDLLGDFEPEASKASNTTIKPAIPVDYSNFTLTSPEKEGEEEKLGEDLSEQI